MPSVTIEARRDYDAERGQAVIDAVHDALVAAFKINRNDKDVRLFVHDPHRFAVPPGKTSPDAYTVVNIDAFAGRSLNAKRALYRNIVDNLEPLGIPKDHVKIVLREIPRENWGLRGGQAACDFDLGFKIDV